MQCVILGAVSCVDEKAVSDVTQGKHNGVYQALFARQRSAYSLFCSLTQIFSSTVMSSDTATIPGPPGLPFIGNISDIDAENPIQSLCNLTDTYGTPLVNTGEGKTNQKQAQYGNSTSRVTNVL